MQATEHNETTSSRIHAKRSNRLLLLEIVVSVIAVGLSVAGCFDFFFPFARIDLNVYTLASVLMLTVTNVIALIRRSNI